MRYLALISLILLVPMAKAEWIFMRYYNLDTSILLRNNLSVNRTSYCLYNVSGDYDKILAYTIGYKFTGPLNQENVRHELPRFFRLASNFTGTAIMFYVRDIFQGDGSSWLKIYTYSKVYTMAFAYSSGYPSGASYKAYHNDSVYVIIDHYPYEDGEATARWNGVADYLIASATGDGVGVISAALLAMTNDIGVVKSDPFEEGRIESFNVWNISQCKPEGSNCTHDRECCSLTCVNGKCVIPKENGVNCSTDEECCGGYCVDGFCSDNPYAACGNGICEVEYENNLNCPIDCYCGDGICYEPYESPYNCPEDCGYPPGRLPALPTPPPPVEKILEFPEVLPQDISEPVEFKVCNPSPWPVKYSVLCLLTKDGCILERFTRKDITLDPFECESLAVSFSVPEGNYTLKIRIMKEGNIIFTKSYPVISTLRTQEIIERDYLEGKITLMDVYRELRAMGLSRARAIWRCMILWIRNYLY